MAQRSTSVKRQAAISSDLGRGKMPYRASIRSPMFITIPYASKCMVGYKVADIPAIMGSFDPCIGETDR